MAGRVNERSERDGSGRSSAFRAPRSRSGACEVWGILNVTPDSFSDGGAFLEPSAAVEAGLRMIEEGAAILDIGPESTRPGSAAVDEAEQIARAVPVIEGLRRRGATVEISIDTRRAAVARAALDAGATMINDVSALRDDPALAELVAERRAGLVLMHMKGTPADMQREGGPAYDDVVGEVLAFLRERRDFAVARGVARERIILDPGLGFGKRFEHNLALLRGLDRFAELGRPVLVGASRKAFLGRILGRDDPRDRLHGSLACALIAAARGAAILRVHDVRPTSEALRTWAAIESAPSP